MKRLIPVLVMLYCGVVFAQRDTLLLETFDAPWDSLTPPPGWRITYEGAPTADAWHRQNPNSFPWNSDSSAYAAIWFAGKVSDSDSLLSPVIDCSRHRNIDLYVSTYFRPDRPGSYTAQLKVSTDGGLLWRTLREYTNDSVGPIREFINVDSVGRKADVRLAWVWDGDLSLIHWWCIDSVVVTGNLISDTDMAVTKIITPKRFELPNPIDPEAIVRNRGLVTLGSVDSTRLELSIWQDDTLLIDSSSVPVDSLDPGDVDTLTFPTFTPALGQTYLFRFVVKARGDGNPGNDTLQRRCTFDWVEYVYYDDDSATGRDHWSIGGNSGWGLKVSPRSHPALLRLTQFKLHVPDSLSTGYRVRIVDDDRPDSSPGTVIYESPVLNAQVGDTWNTDTLANLQIVVPDGDFYVFYIQAGDWPLCPELLHDLKRDEDADYWSLSNGVYARDSDTLNGDWMIRCVLDYAYAPTDSFDARTVFISQPDDELSLRPPGVGYVPAGRVENHGLGVITDLLVSCTVYTAGPTPVYASSRVVSGSLFPNEGAMVQFDTWVPNVFGSVQVLVRTHLTGDTLTFNDTASKAVLINQPHYTGGPEIQDRYAWIDSDTALGPVYNWIDTTGQQFQTLIYAGNADLIVGDELEFFFPYRGQLYDRVAISNNGWFSFDFGDTAAWRENGSLPETRRPNNAIYVFWDHLYAGTVPGSRVCTRRLGYAPNDTFVITWSGMRFAGATGDTNLLDFQVLLVENNGHIVCQYKDVEGGLSSHNFGRSATVGIENATGEIGLQYLNGDAGSAGFWPGNKLAAGRAIAFYQVRRDVGVSQLIEPPNYTVPVQVRPRVKLRNFGSLIQPFQTYYYIKNTAGTLYYLDSVLVAELPIQGDREFEFSPWDPIFGNYVVKCSTAMPGDVDSSNNALSGPVTVQAWLQKADIPRGYYNKRVKAGALAYQAPDIYALKGANTREFWRYSIATDSWDTLPSMPPGLRNKKTRDGCALAAGDGGLIYAVKGANTREFYVYNTLTATWAAGETVPPGGGKGLRNGTCMTYAPRRLYLAKGNNCDEFWRYDLDSNKWLYESSIDTGGGGLVRLKKGACMAYSGDTLIYMAFGGNRNSFAKYNIVSKTWKKMRGIGFAARIRRVKAGAGLVYHNDTLYLLKGGNNTEFWMLDPINDSIWRQRSDIPPGPLNSRVKTGGTMVASDQMVYALKGGNRTEFWMYGPGYDTGSFAATPKRQDQTMDADVRNIQFSCRVEPNPLGAAAFINLAVPEPAFARIAVYDIMGRQVATVFKGTLSRGYLRQVWNRTDDSGSRLANGVYILRFESDRYRKTQKLILE